MRHWFIILSQSENVQTEFGHKNAKRPSIAKRQRTGKKVLYVIVFENKGPVMQISVPKGRTVTATFYKNVVLKKIKTCYKRRRLSIGLQYLRPVHDNARAHKARLVIEFLESAKVSVLPHPLFLPDMAPCEYFVFVSKTHIPTGLKEIQV